MTGRALLAAWLERAKLSQREGAALLEVTEGKLSMYLSGSQRPGLNTALRIQDRTGVPVRSWSLSGLSDSGNGHSENCENEQRLPSRKR
jgi:transcriptional regulator with XRE-family HTH domain